MVKKFRSWLYTPTGALAYFGLGYLAVVTLVLNLGACAPALKSVLQ